MQTLKAKGAWQISFYFPDIAFSQFLEAVGVGRGRARVLLPEVG